MKKGRDIHWHCSRYFELNPTCEVGYIAKELSAINVNAANTVVA